MPIHWFPGHMATARRDIRTAMPTVDLVLEVLDARIPFSSENPLVAEFRGAKPNIQVLNKCDLADPVTTIEWLAAIRARPGMHAIAHHRKQVGLREAVMKLVKSSVRHDRGGPAVAMVLGIPNVGKSTLINALAGRAIAKAANRPAITQIQQRIQVGPDLILVDTPGFLWPKLTPEEVGYRLAVTGALSDRVVDFEDLAAFAARFLLARYPDPVVACYGLDQVPSDDIALIDAIGRRLGYLAKGGVVNRAKASHRLILDVRAACFGPISFETPDDCQVNPDHGNGTGAANVMRTPE